MAADGLRNQEIALRLHISRPTVQLWRERFLDLSSPFHKYGNISC